MMNIILAPLRYIPNMWDVESLIGISVVTSSDIVWDGFTGWTSALSWCIVEKFNPFFLLFMLTVAAVSWRFGVLHWAKVLAVCGSLQQFKYAYLSCFVYWRVSEPVSHRALDVSWRLYIVDIGHVVLNAMNSRISCKYDGVFIRQFSFTWSVLLELFCVLTCFRAR